MAHCSTYALSAVFRLQFSVHNSAAEYRQSAFDCSMASFTVFCILQTLQRNWLPAQSASALFFPRTPVIDARWGSHYRHWVFSRVCVQALSSWFLLSSSHFHLRSFLWFILYCFITIYAQCKDNLMTDKRDKTGVLRSKIIKYNNNVAVKINLIITTINQLI